jgi:hypothetical protein
MHPDTTRRPARTIVRAAIFTLLATGGMSLLSAPANADGPVGTPLPRCATTALPGGGVVISLPCDDPCDPVGPLCDPLPPRCPPITPPAALGLSFAPCGVLEEL